jgi:hypothetical protein
MMARIDWSGKGHLLCGDEDIGCHIELLNETRIPYCGTISPTINTSSVRGYDLLTKHAVCKEYYVHIEDRPRSHHMESHDPACKSKLHAVFPIPAHPISTVAQPSTPHPISPPVNVKPHTDNLALTPDATVKCKISRAASHPVFLVTHNPSLGNPPLTISFHAEWTLHLGRDASELRNLRQV